jgi:YVTN family beta-propeller protein
MAVATVAAGTGRVTFRVLGPLEVSRSGCVVPLGGPRQRAVLAMLLLEANRAVPIEQLADDVWAGQPPDGWVATLQTYVFHLRRALEPDRAPGRNAEVLVTKGRGYLLRVDRDDVDATLFEDRFAAGRALLDAGRYAEAAMTMRAALDLWHSRVFADLADYAFIKPEAARLEELRLVAVESRIEADLALGRHGPLAADLEHLVAKYPVRERLHWQFILALYRCGRQADALAAYRRVRDLLANELGIDPGEPLRSLHAAVLRQDPALDWREAGSAQPDDRDGEPGVSIPAPALARGPDARRFAVRRRPGSGWRTMRGRYALASVLAVAVAACLIVIRPWAAALSSEVPGGSVGLLDPAGGVLGASVTVGSPAGLAYGDGSVWAADSADDMLVRINPATHAIEQRIRVGAAPSAVTVTGANVWVVNGGDGTVSQVSATSDLVVNTIPTGNLPVAVASGPSGVWVADEGDDAVSRIDPATGKVTRTVSVGARPDGVSVGPNAVWVANGEDGTVQRIDPATGQAGGPIFVGSGPAGIVQTRTAVWVANSLNLTVMKLDPATGSVVATIGVGDGPSSIVATRDSIWVGDEFGSTLSRIDPRTDRVRTLRLGSSPQGMVATGSGIWVASRPLAAASHLGGTLTVLNWSLPSVDPTASPVYTAWGEAVMMTAYDGLVSWRRAGGTAGLTLVPDLATALPRPTDGGTTYTFTLRRGIRYSNGTFVRASDFRRGFERQASFGPTPNYYQGIIGASACFGHAASCNLSAGIVTDDRDGTVTFRLTQPDPDFLYKLAEPFAVPAAAGAPMRGVSTGPPFIPGTGPYMIAAYRPNVSLTLVRNPFFRQWSYAAQPAGYPAVIRYKLVASDQKSKAAVIAGRADLMDVSGDDLPPAIQRSARLHVGLRLGVGYLFLNTRQPPFTSIKARQALNYAIDRSEIVRLSHFAPGEATPACQILPADFPGHQGYCPYTAGAGSRWQGPDLKKARRLARESGTTNVPVTVLSINDAAHEPVSSYVVRVLRELGYRARMRPVAANRFFALAGSYRSRTQAGFFAWGADFPDPVTFFSPLLSCQSFDASPANTGNYAEFCDPHADELAAAALAVQPTDFSAARSLWAEVDRVVTDQAPWVALVDTAPAMLVSARVGNCQVAPLEGPLLDQMWVR